jgi:hypothetical protein
VQTPCVASSHLLSLSYLRNCHVVRDMMRRSQRSIFDLNGRFSKFACPAGQDRRIQRSFPCFPVSCVTTPPSFYCRFVISTSVPPVHSNSVFQRPGGFQDTKKKKNPLMFCCLLEKRTFDCKYHCLFLLPLHLHLATDNQEPHRHISHTTILAPSGHPCHVFIAGIGR